MIFPIRWQKRDSFIGKKRSLAGTATDEKPNPTKEEYSGCLGNGQDKILQNNSTTKNHRLYNRIQYSKVPKKRPNYHESDKTNAYKKRR
jgi:hypothetical protein